jgi:hypothetical protein
MTVYPLPGGRDEPLATDGGNGLPTGQLAEHAAGLLGDALDGDALVAPRQHQLGGRVEDASGALLVPRRLIAHAPPDVVTE